MSASRKTALPMMNNIGNIFGIVIDSWSVDSIGHKIFMQVAFIFIVGFTFVLVFASSKVVLLIGQPLMGFTNDIFGIIGPIYISEVIPVVLRGYLTTYINIAFIFGQLIAQDILKDLSKKVFEWSHRILFIVQWFYPLVLFGSIAVVPNSLWWLVRKVKLLKQKELIKD